jgi:hypothetical protein
MRSSTYQRRRLAWAPQCPRNATFVGLRQHVLLDQNISVRQAPEVTLLVCLATASPEDGPEKDSPSGPGQSSVLGIPARLFGWLKTITPLQRVFVGILALIGITLIPKVFLVGIVGVERILLTGLLAIEEALFLLLQKFASFGLLLCAMTLAAFGVYAFVLSGKK